MRNFTSFPPDASIRVSLLSFLLFFFVFGALSAQTKINVTQASDGKTVITTDITQDAMVNNETSYGFFYRIDSDPANETDGISGNSGSYYWKEEIQQGAAPVSKTIILPQGKYSLVTYQTRKSKPIRPLLLSNPVNVTIPYIFHVLPPSSVILNSFEKADMSMGGNISAVKLENSWNLFTDPSNVAPASDNLHYTYDNATQPSQPWLFITLSVQDWQGQKVILKYDDKVFDYGYAIFGNRKNAFSSTASSVSGITSTFVPMTQGSASYGKLTISQGMLPDNVSRQTHIHLVFLLKPDAQFFSDAVEFSAGFENSRFVTLAVDKKPKPHDPNNLAVSKKNICPCTIFYDLVYRVEFQNIGQGPVSDVKIVLLDTEGLNMRTLDLITKTTGKKKTPVKYTVGMDRPSTYTFDIKGINMPGTNQTKPYPVSDDQTWDYIEFLVSTNGCLKDNTFIRPKARVVFSGVSGYLDTNIGQTHALHSAGQSTDTGPAICPPVSSTCPGCLLRDPGGIKKKN